MEQTTQKPKMAWNFFEETPTSKDRKLLHGAICYADKIFLWWDANKKAFRVDDIVGPIYHGINRVIWKDEVPYENYGNKNVKTIGEIGASKCSIKDN